MNEFMTATIDPSLLHNFPMRPGDWWGCSEPERPSDDNEVWDSSCPKCLLRKMLVFHTEGNIMIEEMDHDGTEILLKMGDSLQLDPL